MRCISVTEFGGVEVLKLVRNFSRPTPLAKQVLVNVKAAGINPADTYIRSGNYGNLPMLPYTPGKDGAGVVELVGDNVTKWKSGDRVWFSGTSTGSYAEYCICEEGDIACLPETSSFEEGAMIGVPYLTAYRALFQKGKIQKGETVFIHGATGGVGSAAVQLCKSFGVRVVGTAGSEEGLKMLEDLGVDGAYNHRKPSYIDEVKQNEKKIDVILEMLANINLDKDLGLLTPEIGGRVVIIGSRGSAEILPRTIMANEITVTGVMLAKSSQADRTEQFQYITEGLKNRLVKPKLWKTYALEEAGKAHHEIIENTGARGQIVLTTAI